MDKQLFHKDENRKPSLPISNQLQLPQKIPFTSSPISNASVLQTLRENNVIQMRDDTARILTPQVGTDPTGAGALGIGMSAHHVIPAGLLEIFYELCSGIKDKDVVRNFNKWKKAAKRSTEQTASMRAVLAGQNYQASSAQWMAGNIFVGPIANMRIDDKHDEDTFDYAVERKAVYSRFAPEERKENKNIIKLKEAYTFLTTLFAFPPDQRSNKTGIINSILVILTEVATETKTIHKPDTTPNTPAYNINDWISVGTPAIAGMVNQQPRFLLYYQFYTACAGRKLLSKEAAFKEAFKKYIDTNNIARLGAQRWTLSRYNFEILDALYIKATS